MTDWEDEALSGLDRPRRLPPGLRRRLEEAMASGAGAGNEDLPLGEDLSSRLEDALSDTVAVALAGADAPRPLPPSTRLRMEQALLAGRRTPRRVGAAAAALLVAGGVTAGLLSSGTGSGNGGTVTGAARAPRTAVPSAGGGVTGLGAAQSGGSAAPSVQAPVGSANAAALPAAPFVDGLEPGSGPTGGGTWVVVTGAGFEGVTGVSFGEVHALAFTVVSATEIRAEAPPQGAGTVDVRVSTASGTSRPVQPDRFTYVPQHS